MDLESQRIINPHVQRDEHLLWGGRPKQGLLLRASDAVFIPVGLLLTLMTVNSTVSLIMEPEQYVFPWFQIFILLCSLLALYLLFGKFLLDIAQRRKTFYGVTDGRVIIVSGKRARMFILWPYLKVELSEYTDGFGTIRFNPAEGRAWIFQDAFPGWSGWPAKLERIADARSVYDMIRRAQSAS